MSNIQPQLTRHMKEQENMPHNSEKNCSVKLDSEITEVMELNMQEF